MKIGTDEIRQEFLKFFKKHDHMEIENASLIPENDPTLLIINSGMAPIKQYFTGDVIPPSRKLCNIQKCVRTNDIESVGDPHHLTFFEMMGNWSIGDYFKKDAIDLGWKLINGVFGFDASRIWVTVYGGDDKHPGIPSDDESMELWSKYLPDDRIIQLGAKDNFWGPTSDTGPCGPCTEIYVDRGVEKGCGSPDCGVKCECGRFLEIWNVGVFMEYFLHADRSFTQLPLKSVDAGAGIERFSLVLQDVDSIYETDVFRPMLDAIKSEVEIENKMHSARIVMDHARASVFMLADGIYPGKSKRDYVLRRLMRRGLLHTHLLDLESSNFLNIAKVAIEQFSKYYTYLNDNHAMIEKVFIAETNSFGKVLRKGIKTLDKIVERNNTQMISGADAFKLHDTLGFPISMTTEVARSLGLIVDISEFEMLLEEQRVRSR